MHNRGMVTGERIKAARVRLGENQIEFARRFDVNQATLCRWEVNGLPDRGFVQTAVLRVLEGLERPARQKAG